jgi:3-dehydroquinate synthetase
MLFTSLISTNPSVSNDTTALNVFDAPDVSDTSTVSQVLAFIDAFDHAALDGIDTEHQLQMLFANQPFQNVLVALARAPVFAIDFGKQFTRAQAVDGISSCRALRGGLNLPLQHFFALLGQLMASFSSHAAARRAAPVWQQFAVRIYLLTELAGLKVIRYGTQHLSQAEAKKFYSTLAATLEVQVPHAIYPTSNYRESTGSVESTEDDQTIEAVMSVSTFSSVKMVDNSLHPDQPVLRNIYKPLGRCICLVDSNVEAFFGEQLEAYFTHHGIALHKRVYRAMEVDKNVRTVEKMLGDFKALGVSRNEPVLIVGGGVLADTGGLACALYGRNTPYVMLATSIVTGIDAGPSPRTCCDGFGYKNLFGAYHPPVVSITDRFFFKTLQEGWLRHGIAEIIKMGVVKDAQLFDNLELAQPRLIETRFGTSDGLKGDAIEALSQKILGGALRSYVEAEYDNLYETHQCRPHAYGHTWSPGFEIEAGLLHGHAVSICMGLGAYLSYRLQWITHSEFHRILKLMDGYGLSLWHDILDNGETIWKSQQTVTQKRGQNLVAPLPKGRIGECGYLNALSKAELLSALQEYKAVCMAYPREGRGIDPLCEDVGLENPATTLPEPERI